MGILTWGVHLPGWRLRRSDIADALGAGGAKGTRSVAAYDEDTTTMAVEAARHCLAGLSLCGDAEPGDLLFSTPTPAYLDKTNAAVVHQALDLRATAGAYDMVGSVRSGIGALRAATAMAAAHDEPVLAVVSELRTGLAGSADERDGGDGAVALAFGPDGAEGPPVLAEEVGRSARSAEFLDRWRTPGESASATWEERFGEEVYVPLAEAALADALKSAGLAAGDVGHLVVTGLHARAVARAGAAAVAAGVPAEAVAPSYASSIGNLGAAAGALGLVDALERAAPGQVVAVLTLADGADVALWRTTAALAEHLAARRSAGLATVAELAAGGRDVAYARYLSWRGALRREPPRRPDPERPGAPATWRSTEWRGGFEASRCTRCGFRHLPPTRRCLKCHAVDEMERERLADVGGTVATFTVDHLAFSPSPPVVGVIVDFDGGGRYRCEMTDADPDALSIGQRVEMTFRRVSTAQGVHNYFWKARPAGEAAT